MTPQDWGTLVNRTWLGERHRDRRTRLDRAVRRWLVSRAPGATEEDVTALTVERAAVDILRLGQEGHWLQISMTLSVLGELVLGAREGISLSEALKTFRAAVDPEARTVVELMDLVRNVVCHPANPPLDRLCALIELSDREYVELARQLRKDRTAVGSRDFAAYVLAKVNAVGMLVIARNSL